MSLLLGDGSDGLLAGRAGIHPRTCFQGSLPVGFLGMKMILMDRMSRCKTGTGHSAAVLE